MGLRELEAEYETTTAAKDAYKAANRPANGDVPAWAEYVAKCTQYSQSIGYLKSRIHELKMDAIRASRTPEENAAEMQSAWKKDKLFDRLCDKHSQRFAEKVCR